jgi:cob(I)alamin adenosyltransferase
MTSLLQGERVPKHHPIIETVGTLDELTSQIGKVRNLLENENLVAQFILIQQKLIGLMADLVDTAKNSRVTEEDVSVLEQLIDFYEAKCEPFKTFILPGQTLLSAEIHIIRTLVRRAERSLSLCETTTIFVRQYVNRLADYFYIVARYIDSCLKEKNNLLSLTDTLDLETANQIIEIVKQKAKSMGLQVVIAIFNKEGRPISVQAMDNAFIISFDLAQKKAFTAAALQMSTEALGELVAKGADFDGLENMLEDKIVTLAGGCPIIKNHQMLGAIGVSGGSASQDAALSAYGANYLGRG